MVRQLLTMALGLFDILTILWHHEVILEQKRLLSSYSRVVGASSLCAHVKAHLGQSRTCQRTQWSQCCPCGSSPPPAAPDASSGVSAPAVAALRCAELSYRSPPTSAGWGREETQHVWLSKSVAVCSLSTLSKTVLSLKHTIVTHLTATALNKLHTLIWSLAFISRLRVVCLLASGPKGTRDFKRSKHSRRCARLKTDITKKQDGLFFHVKYTYKKHKHVIC